jgi:hypothetical protein
VNAKFESPTIRLAVMSLGAVAILCVASIVMLAYNGADVPDALAGIGGGAAGALATLLTTFTPSPIPGGRRVADLQVVPVGEPPPEPAGAPTTTVTMTQG